MCIALIALAIFVAGCSGQKPLAGKTIGLHSNDLKSSLVWPNSFLKSAFRNELRRQGAKTVLDVLDLNQEKFNDGLFEYSAVWAFQAPDAGLSTEKENVPISLTVGIHELKTTKAYYVVIGAKELENSSLACAKRDCSAENREQDMATLAAESLVKKILE